MGRSVASKLPGRSERACTARANNYLGLVSRSYVEWTSAEVEMLKLKYRYNPDDIKIPNRSISECINKLKELGLMDREDNKWTNDEEYVLKENYSALGCNTSGLLNSKSTSAIKAKARRMGISKTISKWTSKELCILKENYPILGCDTVKLLPNRSVESIKSKAINLGIKFTGDNKNKGVNRNRWTVYEDEIIKEKYPILGSKIINLLPGRSYSSISNRARRLGVCYMK